MTSRLRAARKGGTLYFMSLSWSETSTAPRSSVCQLIRERSDIYSFRLESGAEIYYNMWRQPYLMQIQRTDALSTTAADVWQYRSLSRILINTYIFAYAEKKDETVQPHKPHKASHQWDKELYTCSLGWSAAVFELPGTCATDGFSGQRRNTHQQW